jgi:PPOX class probable F420-dependent enzyme
MPEPSPVWFHWDGEALLIYSLRGTSRECNIRRSRHLALNFNSEGDGNIVVFSGSAAISQDAPLSHEMAAYAEKYRQGFFDIGLTPEQFSLRYSLPIRVRPARLRGH